jgi:putative colanic acid biosynthesis glycosyltransferase
MIYILTICFNNLKGLQKTYNSIENQTNTNYFWIVIDGNSQDGTQSWLKQLNHTSLEYISEPDTGIYDAMNKAISKLQSKNSGYFIFMNSGDEFYSDNVLNTLAIQNQENAIIYGDYNDIYNDGSTAIKKAKEPAHLSKGMLTSHQAIFFSVSEYKNLYHDLNYKLSGDYDYIVRAFEIARLKNLPTLKLETIICNFYLDGISVLKRKHALKEDYQIRRNSLKLNVFTSATLYLAHLTHFYLKKIMPSIFSKRRM